MKLAMLSELMGLKSTGVWLRLSETDVAARSFVVDLLSFRYIGK
jgi:hypothetical protein